MEQNRTIVHMDLDTFFVSVERVKNTSLMDKPVMIGGMSDRSIVSSCSYETRRFGVSSGMSMKMARYLCPEAIIVRGDFDSYVGYSKMINEIVAEKAPVFEQSSIDEFYLDITGMDRFFGSLKWTSELKQKIVKETHLPLSFGLSVNKTVSKIGTGEAKPNGQIEIPFSNVRPFLHPLPIKKMPGIGDQTNRLLQTMGIKTIGLLSQIPVRMLENLLGKNGKSIWEKSNGIDQSPVVPYHNSKSISTEETFDVDTTDIIRLNEILVAMVEKLAFQLRQLHQLTGCITVKIRYANFDTHSKQVSIPYTSYDHVLIQKARELFDKVYERRMLIRLIGVKLSKLIPGFQQIHLFEDSEQLARLYQAMDMIRSRYGEHSIQRAQGYWV